MKAVFSQWSRPTELNRQINIGFFERETYLWSWALSVELARKHFSEVLLYCDSEAEHLLMDRLNLPFTKVLRHFDNLEMCPAFWSYGKFMAFADQSEPFVHIDSDLFLFNPLSEKDLCAPFLFWGSEDNLVQNYPLYKYSRDFILKAPNPPQLLLRESEPLYSTVNTGLFLVNDIASLQKYLEIVFTFCHDSKNLAFLNSEMDGIMVIGVDQYILKRFLLENDIPHQVLIEGEREQNLDLFEKDGNLHYLGRLKHTRAEELITRARDLCGTRYVNRILQICESPI